MELNSAPLASLKKPMKCRQPKCQKIFIAGTDTGVGKTLFTALLYTHLANRGFKCRAVKPVACGDRADARLLSAIQSGRYSLDEVGLLHFELPVLPFIAAEKEGRRIQFGKIVTWIKEASVKQEFLLIEGCGGLMSPITMKQANVHLAKATDSKVILISRNKLGVVGQVAAFATLAKFLALPVSGVVLMGVAGNKADRSIPTNIKALRAILHHIPICEMPFIDGFNPTNAGVIAVVKKVKKVLAVFLEAVHCAPVFRG